ncbi:VanZ family protein [Lysinibacillus odysseyi]|uniref:VanZ-like domain-containing protein n=1 Tax=Lysinibacillus odysseyi 34hs-1 = NBRC 100172 TaxID=1220589 RepID=A0A0A3JBL2_9BACI|nr:VanZ family protein [Lysinibacillus odysseyi]KGR84412.1 hypothetical protein CD32_12545 [Lysinibacillus odysseyi 34hs-1 = NBRC 100172]
MDLISVVSGLLPYVKYSVVILIILFVGYFVYRKFFYKQYPIRLSTFVCITLLICWAVVVVGITTLSRPANFTGQVNISLFSGYINAWNKWSLFELQLIIFNMVMFMPLGALLPLLHKKNRLFWRVLVLSLVVTLSLEVFQLLSGKGIFELDDLLHNTVGSLAGYFFMMGIIEVIKQRKLKLAPVVRAIAIPLSFAVLFGIAAIVYEVQEFGNMPFKPAQKQSMEQVHVQLETTLFDQKAGACIYYNEDIRNKKVIKDIAHSIAKQFQLQQVGGLRRESENLSFAFVDAEGTNYSLSYSITNGTWDWYTDHLDENPSPADIKQQRQLIEDWLKKESLLPSEAIYQQQDERTIRWDLAKPENRQTACEDFSEGMIIATLSHQQKPESLFYMISNNEMVAKEPIISQKDAYEALVNGEFSLFNPLQKGDTLTITDVQLTYAYDTKGYYRPVYEFTGSVNDPDFVVAITIDAMQ